MENKEVHFKYYRNYEEFKNLVTVNLVRSIAQYHSFYTGDCYRIVELEKSLKKRKLYNRVTVYYNEDAMYAVNYTPLFTDVYVLVDEHKPVQNAHGFVKHLTNAVIDAKYGL